ncbi:MAG TPA: substrate-binding domain-containing protein [Syntrophorhabdaceae bacterium]|nr:substrate-binding domain-containing protein [Syntrophorhabdaceae bacterium]
MGAVANRAFFRYNHYVEILSAKELSKYLKINEKKIYKLAQEGTLPHVKIGGKIAFAKELIDKWILENTEREKHVLIAGSDDPLLRQVIDLFNGRNEGVIYYAPVGSINGLRLLEAKAANMSCVHMLDLEKKSYTLSYIARYLSKDDYRALQLFYRTQGLMLRKDNPKGIRSIKDLSNKGVVFMNRNQGSGTRLLFDFLLREQSVAQSAVSGYGNEAASHMEAGIAVLKGEADAALGIEHTAHILDLDFIPLFEERFDLVIPIDYFHTAQVKTFLSLFEHPSLLHHIRDFTGYDLKNTGSILEADA